MLTRSLVSVALAMAFGFAADSGASAGSRHNNSNNNAHSNMSSHGGNSAAHAVAPSRTHRAPPHKAGQVASKKKGKKTKDDSSDYLVIKLIDASVGDYGPPPKKPQKPQKPQ